jgi:hypothetical protein
MAKTIRDIMTPDPVGVYFDQTIGDTQPLSSRRRGRTFRPATTGRKTACPAKCKKASKGCRTPC